MKVELVVRNCKTSSHLFMGKDQREGSEPTWQGWGQHAPPTGAVLARCKLTSLKVEEEQDFAASSLSTWGTFCLGARFEEDLQVPCW